MKDDRIIITKENPKSPVSEAYRTLRTNIQFSNIDKNIKSILVTSSGSSEGKSTTMVNLAVTIAQSGKKVILIDADLRKPRIHTFFDMSNAKGLTNVLVEDTDYNEIIQNTDIDNLQLLASGPIPPNPSELLSSKKIKNFIEKLKEDYDMVLFDAPPVGYVTDAAVLSTNIDGVILVCAVGQAIINGAKNAIALLQKVNANILGVVINKIPVNEGGYYKYHYYQYYNSYHEDEQQVGKGLMSKLKKSKGNG